MATAGRLHAVILAAGLGSRLWPLTRDTPKSLLDLGEDRTILGGQLDALLRHRYVGEVSIVTGHRSEVIEDFVSDLGSPRVRCVFNPFYALAGPLGSIWAVRDLLASSDALVLNGDTLFRAESLDCIAGLLGDGGAGLVGTECASFAPDDVGVEHRAGTIRRVGKELSGATARSAGLFAVVGEQARAVSSASLTQMAKDGRSLGQDVPWHSWVEDVAQRMDVRFLRVPDSAWVEVDLHPDLDNLREQLAARLTDRPVR